MQLPFFKKPAKSQKPGTPTELFAKGITTIQDALAPDAIEVDFSHLKIGNKFVRTLFVAGYPRFVAANWLSPLINFDHSLDISMFIYPIEGKGVFEDLRRKITEMEAEINSDIQRGRIANIDTQVKLEDAKALQEQLAKGAERFYQFGLYVTITADNEEELNQITKQVQSTLGSLLIIAKPASLVMEQAFKTTQPLGQDFLNITRNMDTTSLATTFPFTSSELTANEGIMYGINEHNDSLVIFDRFSMENANMCVFAKSGGGKSMHTSTNFIVRNGNKVTMETIGPYIDKLMSEHPTIKIDTEIEGVVNPNIDVLTFDQSLNVSWSPVTVAARKDFNKRRKLYKITTKSGREIIITADHNLVTLRNGKIRVMRSEAIKFGEALPLSRALPEPLENPASTTIKPHDFVSEWPSALSQQIIVSSKLTYLFGLITSEGHINPETLEIYSTDTLIQSRVKSICSKYGFHFHLLRLADKKRAKGIRITPNKIAKLLVALGAGGKAGAKRVPPMILSFGNEKVGSYLRGYFDGDGCVESQGVTATTKSKDLASDLAYLLLRFGIIARIHPRQKAATNTKKRTKNTYYEISISGKDQINKFSQSIGFSQPDKKRRLAMLVMKLKHVKENTNVDVIPTLASLFKKLHRLLFTGRITPGQSFIAIKNGVYNPSPAELLKHISACRQRIRDIKSQHDNIWKLGHLPSIDELIRRGRRKSTNSLLWDELGATWQLMKNKQVQPRLRTVLRAYKTVTGETVTKEEVVDWTQQGYDVAGESIWTYNKNLSEYQTSRRSDTAYHYLWSAGKNLFKKYRSLQLKIRHAESVLRRLEFLAKSDLFWDPIASIEKIKHREKYVYDLQVDNGVFLAGSGGMFVHNSYMVKLEILRSLMFDKEVIVIDPEDEYHRMCQAVNGQYIEFSFASKAKINPFDLPAGSLSSPGSSLENELSQKLLSLHSLMKIMLGQMDASQEAILDRALVTTYKAKGISPNAEAFNNEPPLLEDLYKALIGMEEPAAADLAARLEKYVKGSFRGLVDQKTNVDFNNEFIVFGIKNLEDELRPVAMFMILDFIWTKIKSKLKPRLLVVDEAWYLMKNQDSALFLYSMAKRARKYYLGLTTITQDVEDFLRSDYGKAIVTNSSIQMLMKQSAAAVDILQEVFYLSEGEKQLLMAAEIGEGLFFAGQNHVAVKVIASPEEHRLITNKPQELLEMQRESSLNPVIPAVSVEKPILSVLKTNEPIALHEITIDVSKQPKPLSPVQPAPTPASVPPASPPPSPQPLPTAQNSQPTTSVTPSVEFTSIFQNPPTKNPV